MSTPREFVSGRPNLLFFKHILRKIFLEDWFLKLVALLITLGLWYGVSVSSKKGTATMAAQLAFRVSDNSILMSPGVQDVTIRVAGDDQTIDRLFGNDIRIAADLTQTPNGDTVVELTPQNISTNLPSGVRVEDIQPSRIAVTLEPVQIKEVAVEAALVGEPAAGYEVYSTSVTPAKIGIRGPESFMSTLETVPTGPIDIAGARSELSAKQVPISINNPKVAVFNTVADVSIVVGEKRVERSFDIVSGTKKVHAVLFGPRSVLAKTRAADMKVEVSKNIDGAEVPRLTLPDGMQAIVEIRTLKLLGQ
jgi:YbbR domain-containing protein